MISINEYFPKILFGSSLLTLLSLALFPEIFHLEIIYILLGFFCFLGISFSLFNSKKEITESEKILKERILELEEQVNQYKQEKEKLDKEIESTLKLKKDSTEIILGGISHDFNNLLSIILGNLDIAELTLGQHEALRLVKKAKKTSLQAKNLILKLCSSLPKETIEEISIKNILEEALLVLEGSIVKHNIVISENTWPVYVDKTQMVQAFRNIIENSMFAMKEGGTINILVENLHIENSEIDYVKVDIIDQGEGMDDKTKKRIFDPYFSTKQRGNKKGMGLGLYVSQSVVQKHGGEIHIDSQLGVGTLVRVFLPVKSETFLT